MQLNNSLKLKKVIHWILHDVQKFPREKSHIA